MKLTDAQAIVACSAGQNLHPDRNSTDTGVYGVIRSPWGSMHGYSKTGDWIRGIRYWGCSRCLIASP
jgi:hypothetical protein